MRSNLRIKIHLSRHCNLKKVNALYPSGSNAYDKSHYSKNYACSIHNSNSGVPAAYRSQSDMNKNENIYAQTSKNSSIKSKYRPSQYGSSKRGKYHQSQKYNKGSQHNDAWFKNINVWYDLLNDTKVLLVNYEKKLALSSPVLLLSRAIPSKTNDLMSIKFSQKSKDINNTHHNNNDDNPKLPKIFQNLMNDDLIQRILTKSWDKDIDLLGDSTKMTPSQLSQHKHKLALSLIETENDYKEICIKLRQLIAGWSSIRRPDRTYTLHQLQLQQQQQPLHLSQINPSPAVIADYCLALLESIRKLRSDCIDIASSSPTSSTAQQYPESGHHDNTFSRPQREKWDMIGWVSDKIHNLGKEWSVQNLGLERDDMETSKISLKQLKGHLSIDYCANLLLYQQVMNSYEYWRHYPSDDYLSFLGVGGESYTSTLENNATNQKQREADNIHSPIHSNLVSSFLDKKIKEYLDDHDGYGHSRNLGRYLAKIPALHIDGELQLGEEDESNKNPTALHQLKVYFGSLYQYLNSKQNLFICSDLSDDPNSRNFKVRVRDQVPISHDSFILAAKTENLILRMNLNYIQGNSHVNPDRDTYHILMKHYAFSSSMKYALRSLMLLDNMVGKFNSSINYDDINIGQNISLPFDIQTSYLKSNPSPTIKTFNLVLASLRNVCYHAVRDQDKRSAALLTEKILLEMNHSGIVEHDNVELDFTELEKEELDTTFDPSLNSLPLSSYDLVLSALGATGLKILPDLCDRVDIIMERVIGKEAYIALIEEEDEENPHSTEVTEKLKALDVKAYHLLIDIFSRTNNPFYLKRAMAILSALEKRNEAPDTKKEVKVEYPTIWTYNAILKGMTEASKRFSMEKDDNKKKSTNQLIKDYALYGTNLLESMSLSNTSMPTEHTLNRLLRLWELSFSKDAGERAEEILSRMEILSVFCSNNLKHHRPDPTNISYQLALHCWETSAKAKQPGAARRAFSLLERIQAQSNLHHDLARGLSPNSEFEYLFKKVCSYDHYAGVISVCANTKVTEDRDDAFRIAFEVYNQMTYMNMKLQYMTCAQLLACCSLAPSTDERIEKSKLIFSIATTNGYVGRRGRILQILKYVNPHLYEAYEKNSLSGLFPNPSVAETIAIASDKQ